MNNYPMITGAVLNKSWKLGQNRDVPCQDSRGLNKTFASLCYVLKFDITRKFYGNNFYLL